MTNESATETSARMRQVIDLARRVARVDSTVLVTGESGAGKERLDGAREHGTATDTFRRLYWDTALSRRDPVLQMLRSVVGIDRVLHGSDFPICVAISPSEVDSMSRRLRRSTTASASRSAAQTR